MDKKILAQVKADEAGIESESGIFSGSHRAAADRSEQLELAGHWMMERFQQIGLANVHQEPWTIANRWTRGPRQAVYS